MEIIAACVSPFVESLIVPVTKHLRYLISFRKYVRALDTKRKDLDDKRVNVEEHKNHNERNILVVPTEVRSWLEKVREIDEKAANISSDIGSCFNIKRRHKLGRKAFKIIEEINCLIEENSMINWTDHLIPLGKVDSKKASTSTPSSHQNGFKSREGTFMEALEALQPDHKAHMIALCGMGGVGKTTMMEMLKKVVVEKKVFDFIIEASIGEKTDPIVIQQAVADFLNVDLKESSKAARSIKLRKSFEANSEGGKKKILVILDDVWELIDLNDIGLSPLPNQGVGFKVLLTSRLRDVCTRMDVDLIFNVETIEDQEAQSFFHQCVQVPDGDDLDFDLCEIGKDIANRCHGLPIAIKTVASFLKCYRNNKQVWEDTHSSLKNKKVDEVVHQIFETSYNHLQNEEIRSTLLLCGLFPEDFDTPREDLVRYGWGLRLFNNVHTIREARNRVNTYIEQLINANLLIRSQLDNHVKMHDLVRAFVLKVCSNTEHASIVGDISKWTEENTSQFCKRISLTCTGMSEFPRNFKFPDLSLLKLMHGDESLKFPEDFYGKMIKLQVVACDKMKNPLLSRSLECCTNLRTLCLYKCSLMFDCSSIGNLSNLEVLSFAKCDIRKLPSTIGQLRKLKLLDLTYCRRLCINDGFLKKLVNLEELYMRLDREEGIRFINANAFNELVECSKNFTSLEIEFFDKNAPPKNMSFQKIERFKISIGRFHRWNYKGHSFENMLSLVTNKDEIPESIMYHLLKKTGVLLLNVAGMSDLQGMFHNLRVLKVFECVDLRYLFTLGVAKTLSKLERLYIDSCQSMTELIHVEKGGSETIQFPNLKFLYLNDLRNMLSLCNTTNVIELPQLKELLLYRLPTFTSIYSNNKLATFSMSGNISQKQHALIEQAVIPKLEKLHISYMENLKEIWPCEFEVDDCILREIKVDRCHGLVNLFPSNPMSLLHHLEKLKVKYCGSIEVLFNIDLGCNIEESSCCLRSIQVQGLGNLREVWRVKGANDSDLVIRGFQALESLQIWDCKGFRNVFTPTTTNFDMKSLTDLHISYSGESEMVKSRQEQEINVAFPSYLIHTFHNLHRLEIINYRRTEVVFEIESPSNRVELATTPQQPPLLPYLKELYLADMEGISHVWKCNWNKFLIPHQQQPQESSFHNLTSIEIWRCKNIKYLFSPLMAKLLSNLKEVRIHKCDVIEEVVSNRDDEDEGITESSSTNASPNLFPHLDMLKLQEVPKLKRIGCGGGGGGDKGGSNKIFNNTTTSTSVHHQFKFPEVDVVAWSLCQYAKEIYINDCQALPYVIPSYALGQMQKLEYLSIESCKSLVEVFETEGIKNNGCYTTNVDEGSGGTDATMQIPRLQNISVPQLSNLMELEIANCDLLQHVFTFSTIESLMQLEQLKIWKCKAMKVIVNIDDEEQTTISSKIVVFPRLKSIKLADLPQLRGFFLGKNEFRLPLLDDVMIKACPQMTVFTAGSSITPQLNYIHTNLGKHSLECGLNFLVMAATLHEIPFSSLDTRNSCTATSKGTPWSFHNLIEMDVEYNDDVKNLIPSNELLQLQKLEKIHVKWCKLVEEVFEALEGRDNNELQYVVVVDIPKLREVELERLKNLKYIWKNNPWMVLEFPNLTKLSIGGCDSLKHVFSSSTVGSLLQLQELRISDCAAVEVIVKEANVVVKEERDGKVNVIIMLPQLEFLTLKELPSLKGFCLGKEAFSWPSLDTLEINGCNEIRVFTIGHSTTPKLKTIDTNFGRCELIKEQDLNSFMNTKRQEGLEF